MATKQGVVLKVENETARVKTTGTEGCASCPQGACCGAFSSGKDAEIKAENTAGAKEGDHVLVCLETSAVLKSSALARLVPVLFLFIGAFTGQALATHFGFESPLLSILAAFAFMGLSFPLIRTITARERRGKNGLPKIIKIKRLPGSETNPRACC